MEAVQNMLKISKRERKWSVKVVESSMIGSCKV
jgi:hypothetical protein